ncbi:hypothetical protein EVAR_40717_1 [Eumeta japonica]|uniref:Uncharacterized protein n=1 Tax=Eumeta variegata TaxID=151549 RepID=A0A4C1X6C8_EUMVA|nr:hypothetical protein EVAR_40717_1 [Eumeta japonica]
MHSNYKRRVSRKLFYGKLNTNGDRDPFKDKIRVRSFDGMNTVLIKSDVDPNRRLDPFLNQNPDLSCSSYPELVADADFVHGSNVIHDACFRWRANSDLAVNINVDHDSNAVFETLS